MLYHNVRVMGSALRFLDATGAAAITIAVWWIGAQRGLWSISATQPAILVFSPAVWVAFLLVSLRLGSYRPRRTERMAEELYSLLEVLFASFAFACFAAQLTTQGLPTRFYLTAATVSASSGLALRLVMRAVIRRSRRRGEDYRVWLVVGSNPRAERLVHEINVNPHFGIRVDEIVDLPGQSEDIPSRLHARHPTFATRCRMLAGVEEIREILASRVIDEVVVMLPQRTYYDEIERIIGIAGEAGISVKLTPETFEHIGCSNHVSEVASVPLVTHFTGPSSYGPLIIKRFIDVVGAAAGLALLAPFMAILAILVKLDSPGPAFYRQFRIGLHGRRFRIIKFRSMVHNADSAKDLLRAQSVTDGVAFKVQNDPRITPVGQFLRKYHLDELPQLINVLVGDMSLVGPRPLPPDEAAGNEWWQRRRLTMPPGMTCIWQLRRDHHMPFRQWVALDLEYIDGWSVWLDLKLIACTIPVLVRGKGW